MRRILDYAKHYWTWIMVIILSDLGCSIANVYIIDLLKSSPNLCVHSSSSYVSPSMLPLSSGDLIEWSLVCHSTLSYQKFCDRHSNHYDHPEELHQSVE